MPGFTRPCTRRVVPPGELSLAEGELPPGKGVLALSESELPPGTGDLALAESELPSGKGGLAVANRELPQACLYLLPEKEPAQEEPLADLAANSTSAVTRYARFPAAPKAPLTPSSSLPALAARQSAPEAPARGPAYPDTLMVTLDKLHFSEPRKKIFVRVAYSTEVRKTSKDSAVSTLVPTTFVFPCSFHAIVFDVVKVDVFEHKSMGADVHVGRACVPLALLLRSDGERTATYRLRRRRTSISREIPMSGLGEEDFSARSNGEVTVTLLLTQRKYARAAANACQPFSDPELFESGGAGASASPVAARPSLKLVTSSPTLIASSPQISPTLQSPMSPVARPLLRISPSLPLSDMQPFHCGAASPTDSVDSAYSESPTAESPSNLMPEEISCMEVLVQEEDELAEDEDDDDLTFSRRQKKSGLLVRIFSKNTRSLLNDFSAIYNAYFKSGWQLSKLEFMRCMVDLAKYYRENPAPVTQRPPSQDDVQALKTTLYYIKYCIAAYGSALLNYCGYGNGIIDAVRLQSDRKAVCDVFQLDPDLDLIAWQYDKNRVFKPKYFVVRDPHTNGIVVVVRGTFSLQDAMTDLLCEYHPYKGGLAHRGVIKSAEWIVDRSFDAIKNAVARFNATGVNCVGHSLGGAVASLVCLMIHDRLGELAELTSSPEFHVRAYTIGSPPWASRDIAEQAEPLVTVLVNEADLVPRLSFGNVTLMKALVRAVASARRDAVLRSMPRRARAHHLTRIIASHRAHWLSAEKDHMRLFLAGTVFYMYKAGRAGVGPLPSQEERRAVKVERSAAANFGDMAIRKNMAWHHKPDGYDKKLRAALRYLEALGEA